MAVKSYDLGSELLNVSGLSNEQIKDLRLPNFNPSAYNLKNGQKCLQAITNYCNEVKFNERNIATLVGENGTGKSHLAVGAMIRLVMTNMWSAAYVDFVAMNVNINANRHIQGDTTEANYLEAMTLKKILLIDDLDKVPPTPSVMKLLLAVVNYRIDRGKPIIITANNDLIYLEKYWLSLGGEIANSGKAIADRLNGKIKTNIIAVTKGDITSYRRL